MRLAAADVRAERPSIPPLLVFALCFWPGCGLVYAAARLWPPKACAIGFACAAAAALASALVAARARGAAPFVAACGLVCGLSWGLAGAFALHAQQEALPEEGKASLRVLADAQDYGFGPVFTAELLTGSCAGRIVSVALDEGSDVPLYGQIVSGDARWRQVAERQAERAWGNGASAQASLDGAALADPRGVAGMAFCARSFALAAIEGNAPPGREDAVCLMQALLCGYQAAVSGTALYEDFKATGLAHLVAVSGSHLTLACMMLEALLSAVRVGRTPRSTLLVAFLSCYLLFTGCSPSSVRAAVMAVAALCSFLAQRRRASLSAVGIAVVAFVAFRPQNAVSVSFILSALSTLSIVLFAPLMTRILSTCVRGAPLALLAPVSMTLASSVLVGLYSAALFSQASLIGVPANLLATPFFPVLCVLGAASCAAAAAVPALAGVAFAACLGAAELFCALVRSLAAVPFAAIPFDGDASLCLALSAAAGAALWAAWPSEASRRQVLCALGAVPLALAAALLAAPQRDEVVMLDVGQGDAILLRSGGSAVLVDTGTEDAMLRQAMARNGAYRLDAVVITHADDDHMGSLSALASVVEIDRVLVSAPTLECGCESCERLLGAAQEAAGKGGVAGVHVGDALQVGDFSLEVLWPERFSDEGGNADSLCLLATHDAGGGVGGLGGGGLSGEARTMLFTGDAEAEQVKKIADTAGIEGVDVLKVGHHGSAASLDEEAADELRPKVALISVGAGNRYGHPTQECLDTLEGVGARVFRTDEGGDIACTFADDGTVSVEQG